MGIIGGLFIQRVPTVIFIGLFLLKNKYVPEVKPTAPGTSRPVIIFYLTKKDTLHIFCSPYRDSHVFYNVQLKQMR